MSKGPGSIERRITELFAATRDRALTIDEITRHAFQLDGKTPTRVQRLSATRAAHRVVRRVREMRARFHALYAEAHKRTQAALGLSEEPEVRSDIYEKYDDHFEHDPAYRAAEQLRKETYRIGMWSRILSGERRGSLRQETDYWCATTIRKRLYFHPPDVPVQAWGTTWTDRT